MRTVAIIPVKRFAAAKQRLAAAVGPRLRAELAEAMIADVLAAVQRSGAVERVLVVSGEPAAQRAAERHGAAVLVDPADAGHSEAATLGIVHALELGAEAAALLPGDCPLLAPAELDAAIEQLQPKHVTIVPDRHGAGTNGLLVAPVDAIAPAFGEGSRVRHERLARAAGMTASVVELPSLALDVDTPADLAALAELLRGSPTAAPRTAAALRASGTTPLVASQSSSLELIPVRGLDEIGPGDPLGELIAASVALKSGDVVVVSQKVVSKAEGRVRRLAEVEVGEGARELAARIEKDPALVQAVLDESRSIVRARAGVLITETTSGWICANAGIDESNVPGEGSVALLPRDPDASARRVRAEIQRACGHAPAMVIADSFGRPWRLGQSDVAIGCAGLAPLDDWRGRRDRLGRELTATVIAIADEVAAAADLVRDKHDGVPVVLVRGLAAHVTDDDGPGAAVIQRPERDDLFRG